MRLSVFLLLLAAPAVADDLVVRTSFDPGPVVAEVHAPVRTSWIDGVHFLVRLENRGKEPVRVAWQHRGSEIKVTYPNGVGGFWAYLPDLTLKPGARWSFPWYADTLQESPDRGPFSMRVRLTADLKAGARSGTLRVDAAREVHIHSATEADEKRAQQAIVSLAESDPDPRLLRWCLHLLRHRKQPQQYVSTDVVRRAYERVAPSDQKTADSLFGELLNRLPEPEAVRYAAERVRQGDSVPLARCARHLSADARPALVAMLRAEAAATRRRAVDALRARGDREACGDLAACLSDADAGVRQAALRAVKDLGCACGPALAKVLSAQNHEARLATDALGELRDREQLGAVLAALENSSEEFLTRDLLSAAGKLGAPARILLGYLDARDPNVVEGALDGLEELGDRQHADRIAAFLERRHGRLRGAAAHALGKLKSVEHVEALIAAAKKHEASAMTIAQALAEIGGERATQALRGFATDWRIKLDRGLARRLAVRNLVRLLPQERRVGELTAILDQPKTHSRARVEAVKALGPFGVAAAKRLKRELDDPHTGLEAMWQLSRYSAPKRFGKVPPVLPPLRTRMRVADFLGRFAVPIAVEGLDDFAEARLWVAHDRNHTLHSFLFIAAALRRGAVGFIFTDDGIRIVPRLQAATFYRQLRLE